MTLGGASRRFLGGGAVMEFWARKCLAIVISGACLSPAFCQSTFNEREVKSGVSALDKANVWALDYRFKDPRLITVNVPGYGTRIYWYMWYQVINRTGAPRDFSPRFELVTLDHP